MGNDGTPPGRTSDLIRSDFWFIDGNIVIVAGSAAFKVHRGQLERHSEVFGDLFSIPQPKNQELIDGCAYVELPDNPSDVFYFLGAIYDGLYFKKPRASDFSVIAAVLRLATKYLVENLRQRCLARLEADWPSTLAGWDVRERRCIGENGHYIPRDYCPHPILVIELALDMNIPSVLPAALYDLSRYGPSKIMTGTTAPTTAFHRVIGELVEPRVSYEKPIRFSRDLFCRTVRGREASQRFMANFIAKELSCRSPSPECFGRQDSESPSRQYHESFYFIMLNVLRSIGGIASGRDADPLHSLVQATEMLSRTDFSDGQRQCGLKLCQPCKADFTVSALKARQEVWALLPSWFGLVEGEKGTSMVDLD